MTFRVGMEVECIDDRSNLWTEQWVKRGSVYVVSSVGNDIQDFMQMFPGNAVTIKLVGIKKPGSFAAPRFRPVVKDEKKVSFTTGADPESKNWDNRKKVREKV